MKGLAFNKSRPGPETHEDTGRRDVMLVFLIAGALTFFLSLLELNKGIGFADEGWLWYATIKTSEGGVPVRDFYSYDPGRYYWGAGFLLLFGKGILSLRAAGAVFQALALGFGLLALRRVIKSWPGLVLSGVLLLAWMVPRHKIYDCGLPVFAVFFAVWMIENPSWRRHLIAGVFAGLAAFFGRNHGAYIAAAFFLLILLVWYKGEREGLAKRLASWAGGIVIGYSPLLLMLAAVPGFAESFLDSVVMDVLTPPRFPRPVPWPWEIEIYKFSVSNIHRLVVSLSFIVMPLFYLAWIAAAVRGSGEALCKRRILIASSLIGVFYLHHVFARAGFNHLAQAAAPVIIGLIALPGVISNPSRKRKVVAAVIFMGLFSFTATLPGHHSYLKLESPEKYYRIEIKEDILWIRKNKKKALLKAKRMAEEKFDKNDHLLVAPYWPLLYPVLGKDSPVWQVYFCRPFTGEIQKQDIQSLQEKKVKWAIVGDVAISAKEPRHFKNTHSRLWRYLKDNYCHVSDKSLMDGYYLYKRCRPFKDKRKTNP